MRLAFEEMAAEQRPQKLEDAHGTIIDITPPAAVPIPAAKENASDQTPRSHDHE
jgi:hypothetical protein